MKSGNLLSLLFLLLTCGCEFRFSPYSAAAPEIVLNQENQRLIKAREAATPDEFRIALISDTHNYYDDLEDLIDAINRNGPYAFVVVTGDITNYGLLEEYDEARRHFKGLDYPYLVVIGNHDLLSNGQKIFERTFGPMDFDFTFKNLHLVFFNSNNWESGGAVPDLERVERILASSTAPFKALFTHVAPDDRHRYARRTLDDWERIMSTYDVSYYVNGHDHAPVTTRLGTGMRINVGSPAKGGYYDLLVSPTGVTHQKKDF